MIKELSWSQMTDMYPNMWVAIKNATTDGPDVIKGEVIAVKTDEEILDYEDAHSGEGLLFRRTTESEWNGTIEVDFSIKTV